MSEKSQSGCGHAEDCWNCKHENIMLMSRNTGQDCPYRIPCEIVNKPAIKEVRRKLEKSWIDMIQG